MFSKLIDKASEKALFAPLLNLFLIGGLALIILSECGFSTTNFFVKREQTDWILFSAGVVLVLLSALGYFSTIEKSILRKKYNLKKGINLCYGETSLSIQLGKIEEAIIKSDNAAFVLPSNTSFIDDCIRDKKSAMGAIFHKFFIDKIEYATTDIKDILEKSGHKPDDSGYYPASTTIILSEKYDKVAKCILTASTVKQDKIGFQTRPDFICECIRQVFEITSDKKIDTLLTPIFGSGRGGLDINDALFFMIGAIKFYAHKFHHIKNISIFVIETDGPKIKDIFKLHYV